jgi:CheY-like chemotaxis protein
MTDKTIHLLLADDNKSEHIFFTHALKSIKRPVKLDILAGGPELIRYFKEGSHALPDILFLDVNMPLRNGKECLAAIRANERCNDMPVVMYSTSDSPRDIEETYELGANIYVRKPNGLDDLSEILTAVIEIYERDRIRRTTREHYVLSFQAGR